MDYTTLITSEHQKPNFLALVTLYTQAIAANTALVASLPGLFDVDAAVGQQLDYTGQWIGISRNISPPINNVFFSFDSALLGLDLGVFQDANSTGGVTVLDDATYRSILYGQIAFNSTNGSIPATLALLSSAFPNNQFGIQDNGNMTMTGIVAGTLTPISQAILTRGYLLPRPSGVLVTGYITSSAVGAPIFSFDSVNPMLGGFDFSAWGVPIGTDTGLPGRIGINFIVGTSSLG